MPAAASYLQAWGDTQFRAFKIDVVRLVEGRVAEVTTFGSGMFPRFGLPATLDDPGAPGEAHAPGVNRPQMSWIIGNTTPSGQRAIER
jgi:hypothetical protein